MKRYSIIIVLLFSLAADMFAKSPVDGISLFPDNDITPRMTASHGSLYLGDYTIGYSDLKQIYPEAAFDYRFGRGMKVVGSTIMVVGGVDLALGAFLLGTIYSNAPKNPPTDEYNHDGAIILLVYFGAWYLVGAGVVDMVAGGMICHWGNKLIASVSKNYNNYYFSPSRNGIGLTFNF